MKSLRDNVAVVTGAASGIGRGMALAFAEAGMKVVVVDIDGAGAGVVCDEVRELGVSALAQEVDVVDRAALEALADRVYAEFGAAHVLCNNAGVTTFNLMCGDLSDEDWSWVLAVNLQGVINGLQAFLPRMREQPDEKHVVNTASIVGVGPGPLVAPYAATKHALVGISDTLRVEGEPFRISCSVLCPNTVATRICDSERNRQQGFGGPRPESNALIAEHVARGLDPLLVGRMVRQAVLDDVPFVFTHPPETRVIVENRHQSMLESFDWAERWLQEDA
jgi:NAD(P)-dependent dehydrogenase (short-subunit alcohol dehydrogenase family)